MPDQNDTNKIFEKLGALAQADKGHEQSMERMDGRVSDLEATVNAGILQQAKTELKVDHMSEKVGTLVSQFGGLRDDMRAAAEVGSEFKKMRNRFAWGGFIGFGVLAVLMVIMAGAMVNKVNEAVASAATKSLMQKP